MPQPEPIARLFEAPEAISALCRQYHVRRLDLFGSAATGRDFDPERSDADFLVTFEELGSRQYLDAYFGLAAALEKFVGRHVDLVEEDAIQNPYIRRRIEAERRPLFAAA